MTNLLYVFVCNVKVWLMFRKCSICYCYRDYNVVNKVRKCDTLYMKLLVVWNKRKMKKINSLRDIRTVIVKFTKVSICKSINYILPYFLLNEEKQNLINGDMLWLPGWLTYKTCVLFDRQKSLSHQLERL